ncbi:aminomuconate-semialdehyde/2-hydroxymuconate-6-semialdehyde dehydrogenase [Roseivirga ehrenbergii]|uniref:2-hydroxymuconic semialdehyde dehydrogenase n=1 Tax=Roseivirga ehrenbergii (strain DSM 102268 / JCM 13514 / KCTC 12282 / NCIMB 14502 / KMM 6017) TaxID=279360 RepID=A0A150XQP4_ROSEK|nr:aldehyde dehydrogenase [Roseivirga ehrenbergii]KYG81069.1 2-hydroxymuconic semialdehyde dehydrogenase [Roseivirga ehrenbergii]TCL00941.1 aminomuconate-semialdehyde/2-hydroxymuconate-6-semialdehyde dehydrogenase [Roseivirga ehrenbergii]
MERILNYINGQLVEPVSKSYLENIDPSRGKVYGEIPDSDERDVQLATQAAKDAFPTWSATPREERSRLMLKVADLIDANLEKLAKAESKDNGKPVKLATRVDIPRASSNFRFFATAILHENTEAHQTDGLAFNYTERSPVGVAGCVSPWNLPLYLFTWKIAPALAAGNTVVAKPSEITPMTAFLLSELCIEAGLPKGVLNIVHGLGPKVGQAISEHPDIPLISFTGGTATGKQIAATAAPMFKKLSLELGGKNPNIIFADCNFEEALKTTVHSSFANQGQICLCGSRVFIERPIYEKFKQALVKKTNELKVGDPADEFINLGAVVSEGHMKKVLSYIDLAKSEGGTVLAGGKQVKLDGELSEGYYIQPTIIEGLSFDCRTNQEEIFGPVITLTAFDTEEEVLAMANSTQYGLAATVWTSNLNRAHSVSSQLNSGIVWVNCWLLRDLRTPFGGVKNSGVGREGGWDALQFFSQKKNVCIKLP